MIGFPSPFFLHLGFQLSHLYLSSGGLYPRSKVDKVIEEADKVKSFGEKLSKSLPPGGHEDISILVSQRLKNQ